MVFLSHSVFKPPNLSGHSKRCDAALPLSNRAQKMLLSVSGVGNRLSVAPVTGGQNSDGNCSLFAISICLGGVSMTLL